MVIAGRVVVTEGCEGKHSSLWLLTVLEPKRGSALPCGRHKRSRSAVAIRRSADLRPVTVSNRQASTHQTGWARPALKVRSSAGRLQGVGGMRRRRRDVSVTRHLKNTRGSPLCRGPSRTETRTASTPPEGDEEMRLVSKTRAYFSCTRTLQANFCSEAKRPALTIGGCGAELSGQSRGRHAIRQRYSCEGC
jgi:hypothetical protein